MISELRNKSYEKAKERFKDVVLKIETQMRTDATNGHFSTNWECDESEFVYEDDVFSVVELFRERGFNAFTTNPSTIRITWESY